MSKFESNEKCGESNSPRVDLVDVNFCGQLNFFTEQVKNKMIFMHERSSADDRYKYGTEMYLKIAGKLYFELYGEKHEVQVDDELEVQECSKLCYTEYQERLPEKQLNELREKAWLHVDRLERKDLIELMKPKFIAGIYNFLQKRNADDVERENTKPFDFNFAFVAKEHEINPKSNKIELD
jgi:hypothetical protein